MAPFWEDTNSSFKENLLGEEGIWGALLARMMPGENTAAAENHRSTKLPIHSFGKKEVLKSLVVDNIQNWD